VAAHADVAALVIFAAPVRSLPLKKASQQPGRDPERARMAAVLREDYDLGPELATLRNVLIFHGEADDVVPVAHAHEIFQQASHPKRLVTQPQGDHLMSDPHHQEEFIREASLWLSRGLS
jgi:fermentation-respiration switch protein FrsA (DUF1100 family)